MPDNGNMPLNVKELLLAPSLKREEGAELLAPYGLKDIAKADANLQAIATDPSDRQMLADFLDLLLVVVAQSADPDQALTYLERLAQSALNKTRFISYLQAVPH